MRPPRGPALFTARAVVGIALLAAAVLAILRPRQDFDLMAYVGVVHAYDTNDPEIARAKTVDDLRHELTDERFAWMVGRDHPDSYAHAMAHDSRSFAQQLVWFRGRPLYTRSAWVLSKLGIRVPRALHLVALFASLTLGLVFFLATSRLPTPWHRLGAWALVAACFHLDELAASPMCDPLSALLVVSGTLLVFRSFDSSSFDASTTGPIGVRLSSLVSARVGLVLLVVAVSARTDSTMYVAALAAFLFAVRKRLPGSSSTRLAHEALGAAAVAVALRAFVERHSYGWGALVHFRRVDVAKYPADTHAQLDLHTYTGIVKSWFFELYTCEVVAIVVFALVLSRAHTRRRAKRPFVAYGMLMVPLALVRFLAFPDWDYRFFVAPLGLFFVAASEALFAHEESIA